MKRLAWIVCVLVGGCGGASVGTGAAANATSGSAGSTSSSTGTTTGGGTSTGSAGTTGGSSGGGSTTGGASTGTTSGGDLCSTQACVVYAETAHALYTVNPQNPAAAAQKLCTFGGDINGAAINDIAVDARGVLYALSANALFKVNLTPTNGTCSSTQVTSVAGSVNYNALSFTIDGTLLAAGQDGVIAKIDLQNGTSTVVGQFASGYGSSGDFVALSDGRIFATAKKSGTSHDLLVQIGATGGQYSQVKVIGNVGFSSIYGLGFWAGTLYGFDSAGDVLQIDPNTGAGTKIGNIGQEWYGAGTTPTAPIFQ